MCGHMVGVGTSNVVARNACLANPVANFNRATGNEATPIVTAY